MSPMNRCLLLGAILGTVLSPGVWAGETADLSPLKAVLRPTEGPFLRIDFNYNRSKIAPFEKEPPLAGKEVVRGFIPTVPPTPMLRSITDHQLYLSENHSQDFVTGRPAIYRDIYDGHVVFRDLRLSTVGDGIVIPYTADLYTYEHGLGGWLHVRSAWEGSLTLDGQPWRFGVVDNLDGRIDDKDLLYLQKCGQEKDPLIRIQPLPRILCVAGHIWDMNWAFQQTPTEVVLEANLTELQLPSGQLTLEARGCRSLRLENERMAVILDSSTSLVSLPIGVYRLADCILDQKQGRFAGVFDRSDQSVCVQAGSTAACLRVGTPLRNTVVASRDRNLLRLEYRLLGAGGEQYRYYNWEDRPQVRIYKGSLLVASGVLPFG